MMGKAPTLLMLENGNQKNHRRGSSRGGGTGGSGIGSVGGVGNNFKLNMKRASKAKAKNKRTNGKLFSVGGNRGGGGYNGDEDDEGGGGGSGDSAAAASTFKTMLMVGKWKGVAPGSQPVISHRWMLGAGYEKWCALPVPKKVRRSLFVSLFVCWADGGLG
jgi:hypothetical protein